ncbi:MAG: alpha/beta hydrolase [Sulfurospirillaceae bacterium]|nr:alpha/beta hydrolase [Sulfurospirillaceae bacterium]
MAIKETIYNDLVYQISYEIINQDKQEEIIFLHGWGSNKEIMKNAFSKHLSEYRQIYIDLPGFGNSSITRAITTQEYAKIINTFLDSINSQKKIIFGHSFGGKVATLLNPEILVLLSSAGILNKKPLKTKAKILTYKLLKPIAARSLYKYFATKDVNGMSQVMYETLKNVVDENFEKIFADFEGKGLVYWGRDDTAVPLWNGEKIANLIKDSKFRVYYGDHFFFLKDCRQICDDFRKDLEKRI